MKTKMRYLAAIAAGFLMVSNIAALDEKHVIAGGGSISCGKFIADTKDDEFMSDFYFSWVQGFLSGLNFKYLESTEITTDLSDHEALQLWIKNYCNDNPLDLYYIAAGKLWVELRHRQGLSQDTTFITID
ncbi:MAG: hypothetical protein IID58_13430 [Proteobacteria bacterium]|nr:hypothetical protein [Pseudomonadota bacterium]